MRTISSSSSSSSSSNKNNTSPLVSKKNILLHQDETEVSETTESCYEEGPIIETTAIHDLVNHERTSRSLKVLKRSRPLDLMAQKVVNRIADKDDGTIGQIPMASLQKYLHSGWVGQTVETGKTVVAMHRSTMVDGTCSRDMILNKQFKAFGVATAQNETTGNMYMVQIFRGKKYNS